GERVDELRGVAVGADGREDGLPHGDVFGGAAVGSEDVLVTELAAHVGDDGAVGQAVSGHGNGGEGAGAVEGVGVGVEVDVLEGVEVYRVGTGDPGSVVHVGIEDLGGEGAPASC